MTREPRITGPAGLDMGAAGYCHSGKHLWLCPECRRRCCNGYQSVTRAKTDTAGLEDVHPYTEPARTHLVRGWLRTTATP